MSKFNLFNKNEKVGIVNSNDGAIKFLSKKSHRFIATLLFSLNIGLTLLSGCDSKDKNIETIESIQEENIADLNRERFYTINGTDGEIMFVTGRYLNDHNYIPIDTIATRHEFLEKFFRGTEYELQQRHPDKDFSEFMIKYGEYANIYKDFTTSEYQNAYTREKYVYEVQGELIHMAEEHNLWSYIPNAIPYEEYLENIYADNKDDKRVLGTYTVQEGDTLSELVNDIADDAEEYKKIFDTVVAENNIEDPDVLEEGQVLHNIPCVGPEDYEKLGVVTETTPLDELFDRVAYLSDYQKRIQTLKHDFESEDLSRETYQLVQSCLDRYKAHLNEITTYDYSKLLYDTRKACDYIELLTGNTYEAPLRQFDFQEFAGAVNS